MNKQSIYLDHAAASPPSPHILEVFSRYALNCGANQEAIHRAAYNLRLKFQEHEELLLQSLCGANHQALVQWTDSGTTAICNVLAHPYFSGGEAVSSGAEHAALTAGLARLKVPVKNVRLNRGIIDLDHLDSLLSPATRLVALLHVQSETGAMQDLAAIRRMIDQKAPQALFLADTTQSAAKLDLHWNEARLDFAIVSGYKTGAPGGAAIICREQEIAHEKLSVFFQKLRKEHHQISRPNPALCLTLAQNIAETCNVMEENRRKITDLNHELRRNLQEKFPSKIRVIVPEELTSPYILHFLMPGYQGAVLVRLLSDMNVFIASGSACNAETQRPSQALLASGVKAKDAFAGLRISFASTTTAEDIAGFFTAFSECVASY